MRGVHVIPIKTCCEGLFGYMVIIKIIDYVWIDYSLIAFVGVSPEISYESLGKSHLSKGTTA